MGTTILDGPLFAKMVGGGVANLNKNRSIVNDLNVFPVPDGDTGDNMYMTIDSGYATVSECRDISLEETSSKVAHGMLMGARGNSGVILSRIFSGIAKGLEGHEIASVSILGEALERGVKESYQAVSVPVEGTILTVYKDAVSYANRKIHANSTLESYFNDFINELRNSLEKTPELLAVLKEAGVVDSGGAGIVYIVEGMKDALNGKTAWVDESSDRAPARNSLDTSSFTENSTLEFGYCTEFLLQLQNSKVQDVASFDESVIKDYLNENGESVVAFRDGSILKVHVHTYNPGQILNFCQQYGEFLTLKIENMMLQHNETTVQNRFEKRQKVHKAYGIVSVASGEGICETFTSLGVDAVVEGGQSMNPSAEDFIKAFESIDADTILVFPNNGNVILAAQQAASLYDRSKICVVPSKTIGEGYAAISMLDTSSGDTEQIVEDLKDVMAGVVTGMVSQANRETVKDGVSIHPGDYIGFAKDVIYSDDASRMGAARELCSKLQAEKYDVMLIISGQSVEEKEAQEFMDALASSYPRTEVIHIRGNQPIYDYIIILE